MNVFDIARIAHEANRQLCLALGDLSQPIWEEAPEWQRDSAVNGVNFHRQDPDATPEKSHEAWMAQKVREGWTYGPVKDPEAKQHPCMVAYSDLPPLQRAKDHLFRGICHALLPFVADQGFEAAE